MKVRYRIVIFHYHLKKGGVTSVIKEQVAVLKADHDLLIITGETPENFIHENVLVIPELGYSKITDRYTAVEQITQKMLAAIERFFGTMCDLVHFHNPTLAKNQHIIKLIKNIARQNIKIFLQIHDFAEDGRALSYINDDYPENVHYGVINSRDYHYLLKSGLKEKGLHLIPNCIQSSSLNENIEKKNLILYPVRAIRRKNIGEVLLLSLFLNKPDYIGITLPAMNPNELKSYEDWKFFSKQQDLKVTFDLGLKYNFTDLISQSKFIITTSITEGFGFAFLEPWIWGRFIFGRIIREICHDFISQGINLDLLYDQFLVPTDIIDKTLYLKRIQTELKSLEKNYGKIIAHEKFLSYFLALLQFDFIDFGFLPESIQRQIILECITNKALKNKIYDINHKLQLLNQNIVDDAMIKNNQHIIRQRYSIETYQNRLNEIYHEVIHTPVEHKIDKNILISNFLRPENFYMLKWGRYEQ